MPRYSYHCEECGADKAETHDRGEAPDEIDCECGAKMIRSLRAGSATNISSKEPKDKTKKLKDNLKKRQKKIDDLPIHEQEQFKTWSKRQTGGRW